MRFLTNIYSLDNKDAKEKLIYPTNVDKNLYWQHHKSWVNIHVIGRPKATELLTTQELIDRGFVGLYSNE